MGIDDATPLRLLDRQSVGRATCLSPDYGVLGAA